MATLLQVILGALLVPGITNQLIWSFVSKSCGWRYGGQCKASCAHGEYILGTVPCAYGILGTCCSPDLPCPAYGGVCRDGGCFSSSETPFTYKVRCTSMSQTCCVRKPIQAETGPVYPQPTTSAPSVPRRCTARRNVPQISSRILGGSSVNSHCQWPWMVSIRLGSPDTPGPHICAGVLISDNKVLTTVGCVLGNKVFVTLGETDITRNGESGEVNIPVSRNYLIHEGFNSALGDLNLYKNDIAMLTLDYAAPSSSCADPVCLPRSGERATDLSNCYIAGWGINTVGDGLLHEANVRVLNNTVCGQALALAANIQIPYDKLCTAPFLDGSDACPGDNGGMLVCEDATNNWSLFGLISDNACSQRRPVIYTDVQSHMDWINRNL